MLNLWELTAQLTVTASGASSGRQTRLSSSKALTGTSGATSTLTGRVGPWSGALLALLTMKPKQVAALRKRLALSQSQLARRLGVNRVAVCCWEKGTRKPSGIAVKFMELLEWLHDRGIEYGQEEENPRNLRTRK